MPGGAFQYPDIPMDVEQKFRHRGHRVAIWRSDLVSCQAALSKIQLFNESGTKILTAEHADARRCCNTRE